jgi:predicted peptidase
MTLALLSLALAAGPDTGFVTKVFKNADGHESPYVLFVPHGYDKAKPTPVVLFLHGSGETKGDKSGKMPVEQGIGPYLKGRREKTFPALVIIPQAETRGWQADGESAKRAMLMLDEVTKEYTVDPKRVYLTGLSMGGFGTWSLAAAHPDKWAAIVPVCGGLRWGKGESKLAETAEKIKDIPCWCWHGGADPVVKPELSREVIDALKAAGGKPRYTELEGVGHESWDACYASEDVYRWLFKQKKQ